MLTLGLFTLLCSDQFSNILLTGFKMDPFILKKKEARVLAIWETLCQHPDVRILLHNLLNQCNIKLCRVGGRVKV